MDRKAPATTTRLPATSTLNRTGDVVGISFEGASTTPSAHGVDRQPGVRNYFIGNDRSHWASGVRLYSSARVERLYDGIDALFYLDAGRPRYDLVVAAGADPAQVKMKIEGGRGVSLAADGSLSIATKMGVLEQRGLYAYQEIAGERHQVACSFVVGRDGRVSFAMGSYDRTRALVIDPLVYSTYLGGNDFDQANGIAVDASGNAYAAGSTQASDFPVVGEYQRDKSLRDAFVTKLAYSGSGNVSLVYSTYIGGDNADFANGIAVDGIGNAYIVGYTLSEDFPTVNQYQGEQTSDDAFVVKFAASGGGPLYSTYLGGSDFDQGYGIAVDGNGNAYVTGFTISADFPTVNQYQTHQTDNDAFVAKLAYSGSGSVSLVYSTYLGGSGLDKATAIAVDGSGNAYVAGYTFSTDFPTVNQYQGDTTNYDAFVIKFAFPDPALSVEATDVTHPAVHLNAVAPNPAREQMDVSFSLPDPRTVTMEIYATDGRLIAVPVKTVPHGAGSHTRSIAVDRLQPGVYALRMTAGNTVRMQRFVVVR